jgi:DNA helicase-4
VDVVRSDSPIAALAAFLATLSEGVAAGTIVPGPSGTVSVDVLGRYNFEAKDLPRLMPANLNVTFRTVHGSKGLEADYIVLPNMITGTYGFPSTITDDPVLHLAMPTPETYEHAEERRLFYVALTRARRAVTLITDPHHISPFVVELLDTKRITVDGAPLTEAADAAGPTPKASTTPNVEVCPKCGKGILILRRGPYGRFLGCSTFSKGQCNYTRSLESKTSFGKSQRPGSYPSSGTRKSGSPRYRPRN